MDIILFILVVAFFAWQIALARGGDKEEVVYQPSLPKRNNKRDDLTVIYSDGSPPDNCAIEVFSSTSIKGVTSRQCSRNFKDFLQNIQKRYPNQTCDMIALERDPNNSYDPNAIKVMWKDNDTTKIIGYLPAECARKLNVNFPNTMPLAAAVRKVFKHKDGGGGATIAVFRPHKRSNLYKQAEAA